MNTEQNMELFRENLAMKIDALLSPEICKELISKYENFSIENPINITSEKIIKECSDMIFVNDLDAFLTNYFQSKYKVFYSTFDVVDSSTSVSIYPSKLWHLDGGIPKTLKLFLYLTPVSEHGGNTIYVDQKRTKMLIKAGELPINMEERKEDLTQVFDQMGVDNSSLAYDLKVGDGLLFSPLLLAHRCLPPKEDKKRYTISFTLVPRS